MSALSAESANCTANAPRCRKCSSIIDAALHHAGAETLLDDARIQPLIKKAEVNPGSVVLVAIEVLETESQPRITWGWFDPTERTALKAALTRAKRKRGATT